MAGITAKRDTVFIVRCALLPAIEPGDWGLKASINGGKILYFDQRHRG